MRDLLTGSGLLPPQSLTVMITNRCNLRCRHCWPESGPGSDYTHVEKDKLRSMLRDFRGFGIDKVILTGGEPLLHPDWLELVSNTCTMAGIKEVWLQTNATLLTGNVIGQLVSIPSQNLNIQISLDGSRAKTHDRMRGVGSFNRALEGLIRLAESGWAEQIRVAFTETADNFEEIPSLLRLLRFYGISRFVSGTLVNGGRAATTNGRNIKPPVSNQYEKLLHWCHEDQSFKEQSEEMAEMAPLAWYRGKTGSSKPGCTFLTNPYITADGTMFPCAMFQVDHYAVHDVYDQPLAQTLKKIIPRWAELQQLSKNRPEQLLKCRTCPGRLHCRGGCMGRAYMAHGVLTAVEDRCDLRRAVYDYRTPGCRDRMAESNT